MPKRNAVLHRQTRKMIYNVSRFMQTEADGGIKININHVQKRVAAATGVSTRTVRRINAEANNAELLVVFRTPGKKRSGKKNTNINSFDESAIKRCVHNFHNTEKKLPTVGSLLRKLQDEFNFQGSPTSLRRILKRLGFQWKKTADNRKIVIEQSNIRLKRIEFLLQIARYRGEGRPIIYTDESYVESPQLGPKEGIKKKKSKGQRVIIVHAGSRAGFVPNALLLFKAGTKSGDYQDKMNFQNYEKWLKTQLIPNLPPRSVVVVDNASYHNKKEDHCPASNGLKSDMQAWLREKGISFSPEMLKPQLYKLILLNKEKNIKFNMDHMLEEYGHTVLRLPPYHSDLNPIEMAWLAIKGYVANKNINWNINKVMDLIREKCDMMGEPEWMELCAKVESIEDEYRTSDHVIDALTDEIIIRVSENESESETEEETESSEDDSEVEPCSSTSTWNFYAEKSSQSSKEPDATMEVHIKDEPAEWDTKSIEDADQSIAEMFHSEMSVKPEPSDDADSEDESLIYSPLACELCAEVFTVPAAWVRHVQGHSNYDQNSRKRKLRSSGSDDDSVVLLRCDLCQKHFLNPAEWVRHIQNTHTETEGVQNKTCTHCNKTFPSHASMLIHMRTHTGERPFICGLCNKGFSVKSNLVRHLRTLHDHQESPPRDEPGPSEVKRET
ncbi:uncharacterized protein [Epargyreus clarus]|uniref:uncharacterized protein isoform X2 n=1 Tax=Epargyreus clarus TaxID=520877 RepID=UPI003C2BEB2F